MPPKLVPSRPTQPTPRVLRSSRTPPVVADGQAPRTLSSSDTPVIGSPVVNPATPPERGNTPDPEFRAAQRDANGQWEFVGNSPAPTGSSHSRDSPPHMADPQSQGEVQGELAGTPPEPPLTQVNPPDPLTPAREPLRDRSNAGDPPNTPPNSPEPPPRPVPPVETQGPTEDEVYTTQAKHFIQGLVALVTNGGIGNPGRPMDERVQIRDPDVFTGESPHALQSFFGQCELVFQAKPGTYASDRSKIIYMASNFRKTAQVWWQQFALHPSDPPALFLLNYSEFKRELQKQFGAKDVDGSARAQLDHLVMPTEWHILEYNLKFQGLVMNTQYDDYAKRHAYYKGLPERIKDAFLHAQVEWHTYEEVRDLAQKFDDRFWRREEEKHAAMARTHHKKHYNAEPTKKPFKSDSGRRFRKGKREFPKDKPLASSPGTGPDGHLTKEERERRLKENLCLVCADPKHKVRDCPHKKDRKNNKTFGKAKARAAEAEVEEEVSDTQEPADSEN